MFKKYGVFGLLLIIIAELSILFNIHIVLVYFFPIVWWGYILLIDAIIFKIKKNSLISNRSRTFLILFLLSAPGWFIFDIFNIGYSWWNYIIAFPMSAKIIFGILSFGTVFPAIFETAELLKTLNPKNLKLNIPIQFKINKSLLYSMMILGVMCMIIPFIFPRSRLALFGWIGFFFILDPINYMHNEPSIIGYLKRKDIITPASFFISGYICGFLWEFWNFWAKTKWYYDITYLGLGPKIFEMPVLGYIPYGFFALEVFSMYYFVRTLYKTAKKDFKKIEERIKNK